MALNYFDSVLGVGELSWHGGVATGTDENANVQRRFGLRGH